jgi:hypothetical protein
LGQAGGPAHAGQRQVKVRSAAPYPRQVA